MTSTQLPALPVSDVDLFSDEMLLDPFEQYRALRDAGPVVYLSALGMPALPRYAEVRAALKDWQTFTSTRGNCFNEPMNQMLVQNEGQILTSDPPEHGRLRAVLADRLNSRAVRQTTDQVAVIAEGFVDSVVAEGGFDAATIARDFPKEVVGGINGFPRELCEKLPEWGNATSDVAGPLNARTQAGFAALEPMFAELGALTTGDLTPGSLGWAIFDAADRGDIDPATRVDMLWNLTGPAIDTTISAMGTLLLQLASDPEQWRLVRSDEALVTGAVNEAVRYDSPIQAFTRYCRRDWDAGGSVVPAGSRVVVMYGCANRDERYYTDPDRFDVRRAPGDHLGFGFGVHACLGAQLARLEMRTFVAALARRVATMEAGTLTRNLSNISRKLRSLPVTVTAAAPDDVGGRR